MKSFELEPGQNLFIQGGSFLASDLNVELDTKFQGMRGLFSGENLFFLPRLRRARRRHRLLQLLRRD